MTLADIITALVRALDKIWWMQVTTIGLLAICMILLICGCVWLRSINKKLKTLNTDKGRRQK